MTGKSDHSGTLAHRVDRAQTIHRPDGSAECTLLSFQRPLRLCGGIRRSSRTGQPQGPAPEGRGEYSAAAARLPRRRAKAAEAALADLQDPAIERRRSKIEAVGRDRLAVEPDPSLADQAPGLAGADLEGARDQGRQVNGPSPSPR